MGEQLDGQFNEEARTFLIYRHKKVDSAREQLQGWVNQTAQKSVKSSAIELFGFATIGLELFKC